MEPIVAVWHSVVAQPLLAVAAQTVKNSQLTNAITVLSQRHLP